MPEQNPTDTKTLVTTDSIFEAVTSSTNISHWDAWIEYFEDQISQQKGIDADLQKSPMYAAWLWSSSENIFQKIKQHLFAKSTLTDAECFDNTYSLLMSRLSKNSAFLDDEKKSLRFILICRNIITHKGFPELYYYPTYERKDSFLTQEVEDVSAIIKNPLMYETIKGHFRTVREWLSTNRDPRSFTNT